MRLLIRHLTRHRYDPGTLRLTLIARLWPASGPGQQVGSWTVTANGNVVQPTPDGRALMTFQPAPDTLELIAEGWVDTEDRAGVTPSRPGDPHPAMYLKDSPLTEADDAVTALAARMEGPSQLARLHHLNELVHSALVYRAGATATETTAAAALAQGSGVCQDHAQLFIAAARSQSIPARYVAGYLLAATADYELHETHAWAEAFVDDLGWVGFDPSNNVCPNDHYVRLTIGLDAHDAAPIRGHIQGGFDLGMDADVRITPAGDGSGGQQQQQAQAQSQAQIQTRTQPRTTGGDAGAD